MKLAVSPPAPPLVLGGREFPRVTWYKDWSLIHLHFICGILLLSSATNGYDGSMSESMQKDRKAFC